MTRPRSQTRPQAKVRAKGKKHERPKAPGEPDPRTTSGAAVVRTNDPLAPVSLPPEPSEPPHGLSFVFRFGGRSAGAAGVLDAAGAAALLHGIVAILCESPYAPSEVNVGEFLAHVLDAAIDGPSGVMRGLFVLLDGSRPVAFAQVRLAFEDAEIDYVAVHPEWRNRGLGGWLLARFEAEAIELGAGRLLLEVGERNIPARQLYRSWGFEPMGRRENYYSGKEAALVLEKPL